MPCFRYGPTAIDCNFTTVTVNVLYMHNCTITLQEAYNESRKVVIHEIIAKLKSLFSVQPKTEEMEDASRGYGMLLHACGLTTQEKRASHCKAIKAQVTILK